MPSYSGVWNLVAVYQAVGADAWSNDNTRALFAAGYNTGYSNVIDYTTIKTTGNAIDFGDFDNRYLTAGCSSSTRGLFAGGFTGAYTATSGYVTIATLGNTTNFGNLT
jgi:hypothetical protein